MKKLGNFLWCVLGGFIFAAVYSVLGLVFCLTLVGIPFGKQYFKLAKLVFKPFGKIVLVENKRPFGNFLWNILGGIVFSLVYFVLGVVLCVTLIGIPFGKQCLKLAGVAFKPFNKAVV
ncbi:MAG: hypothetical protein IKC61_00745 [Clostridia bacterium]|jgi:uncharacterized membrane protein YccF (DUF307 family)|nr:hypothetical protein [Clostridia bacterium]